MTEGSVRIRLLIAVGFLVAAALFVSGLGLEALFRRHVERRASLAMQTDVRALLAALQVDDGGTLTLARRLNDQRYRQPFSGLYWQISTVGRVVARSRSLWDEDLALPDDDLPFDGFHQHRITGPRENALLVVEHAITVARAPNNYPFRISVALELTDLAAAIYSFRSDLALSLGVLGIGLLAAFWFALNVGLAPLRRLRTALGELRSGRETRLVGAYPREIAPLVGDLNDLLDRQDKQVTRSRARAGDLAHGLKTPLTAISVLADELNTRAEHDVACELLQHVDEMQRHIERELTRARVAHSQTAFKPINIREFIERFVRTMRKLPRGHDIVWSLNIADDESLSMDETLLAEIVGNILDNSRKWAKSTVEIVGTREDGWFWLEVCDNGEGVADEKRGSIVKRGIRLDEALPGTGLGLSIVSEIIDDLGGLLELDRAPLGGLKVRVGLPCRNCRR